MPPLLLTWRRCGRWFAVRSWITRSARIQAVNRISAKTLVRCPQASRVSCGNYTLGLRDQLIFPEIDYAKVDKTKGMNVTIVTTAGDDDGARALLKGFGMPFRVGA